MEVKWKKKKQKNTKYITQLETHKSLYQFFIIAITGTRICSNSRLYCITKGIIIRTWIKIFTIMRIMISAGMLFETREAVMHQKPSVQTPVQKKIKIL